MKQQWKMMKNIAKRYRELGMSSQLPAFQGNVPVQRALVFNSDLPVLNVVLVR